MADFLTGGEAGRAMLSRGMTKSSGRMDGGALMLAIKLATLDLKLQSLEFALERHYRPDQPRVPAGHPQGGQWTRVGGSQPEDRTRIALAGVLIMQRVGVGDDGMIRHCIFEDMFGRQRAREIDASESCPPTLVFPPYYGPTR